MDSPKLAENEHVGGLQDVVEVDSPVDLKMLEVPEAAAACPENQWPQAERSSKPSSSQKMGEVELRAASVAWLDELTMS